MTKIQGPHLPGYAVNLSQTVVNEHLDAETVELMVAVMAAGVCRSVMGDIDLRDPQHPDRTALDRT